MEIRVDNLQESPLRLTFEEPLANLPLLTEAVAAGEVVVITSYSIHYTKLYDKLHLWLYH